MDFTAGQRFSDPAGLRLVILDVQPAAISILMVNPSTGHACTVADRPEALY
jgi:hypothetical protein